MTWQRPRGGNLTMASDEAAALYLKRISAKVPVFETMVELPLHAPILCVYLRLSPDKQAKKYMYG